MKTLVLMTIGLFCSFAVMASSFETSVSTGSNFSNSTGVNKSIHTTASESYAQDGNLVTGANRYDQSTSTTKTAGTFTTDSSGSFTAATLGINSFKASAYNGTSTTTTAGNQTSKTKYQESGYEESWAGTGTGPSNCGNCQGNNGNGLGNIGSSYDESSYEGYGTTKVDTAYGSTSTTDTSKYGVFE